MATETSETAERADRIAKLRKQALAAGAVSESWGKRGVDLLLKLGDALAKQQDAAQSENIFVARIAAEGEGIDEFAEVGTRVLSALEAAAQKTVGSIDVFEVRVPRPLPRKLVN